MAKVFISKKLPQESPKLMWMLYIERLDRQGGKVIGISMFDTDEALTLYPTVYLTP